MFKITSTVICLGLLASLYARSPKLSSHGCPYYDDKGKYQMAAPGEYYMDDCNTCYCGEMGLARCTKMACPEILPSQGCPYYDAEGSLQMAMIGESYMDDCNSCYCEEMGIAQCTRMACPEILDECLRSDIDFYGADISSVSARSPGQCAAACRTTDRCVAITFIKSGGECWMKYRRGGVIGPSNQDGYHSMNMECDNRPVDTRFVQRDQDFTGADLTDPITVADLQECVQLCRDTVRCEAVTLNGNICYLKFKEGRYGLKPRPGFVSYAMSDDVVPVEKATGN